MAYYEWKCDECNIHFECSTERGERNPKFFCPECKSKKITLTGYDINTPTPLQFLANEVARLTERVRLIDKSLGIESEDDEEIGSEH